MKLNNVLYTTAGLTLLTSIILGSPTWALVGLAFGTGAVVGSETK